MMLSFTLPAELAVHLKALAEATGRSEGDHVNEAVLEHLAEHEARRIAEQRLADIRSGKHEVIPLEEVMRRHGMGG